MNFERKSRLVWVVSAATVLTNCSTKEEKEIPREIAAVSKAVVESCKSPENKAWFDNGRYAVVDRIQKSGRWSTEDNDVFAPYSLQKPIPSNGKTERWQSPFSRTTKAPSNRDEFFSRGTMYYFEFAGMEDQFREAESNFRLEGAQIVGAQSIIHVYRIDGNESALKTECPGPNSKGVYVGSIPFFSLRTSGNRTNQMPKSSFKVKILNPEKWEKQALTQYQQSVRELIQAPQQIVATANEYRKLLGASRITDAVMRTLLTSDRSQFAQDYPKFEDGSLNSAILWKVGKLRNGMLWWKGQLKDAVKTASPKALQEAQSQLSSSAAEALVALNSAIQGRPAGEGWPEILNQRRTQTAKASEDQDFLGMTSLNLKAMWNDPSQMREALAWYMFEKAQVVAPKHTYAKVCFGNTYRGVFSVVEQIDEKFIESRLSQIYSDRNETEKNWKAKLSGYGKGKSTVAPNLYKVYMGTEDVGLDREQLEDAFKKSKQAQAVPDFENEKNKVISAFVDNPERGKRALQISPFRQMSPFQDWLAEADYYFENIGGGTLKKVQASHKGQISPYFKSLDTENRTYQLQTDWDDVIKANVKQSMSAKQLSDEARKKELARLRDEFARSAVAPDRYKDLEKLIETLNAGDGAGGAAYYASDAFFKAMNEVLDTKAFLRWAGLTVLLGAWDNYYMNPQNYYLLNKVPMGLSEPRPQAKFMVLPWDYDQSFSMGFGESATLWWNTDILDWEVMRREKRPGPGQPRDYENLVQRPLVTHLLKNPKFKTYYLRFIDWMLYNHFHAQNVASLIGRDRSMMDGDVAQWQTVYGAASLERRRAHKVRIQKEVWDFDAYQPEPGVHPPKYWKEYQARMVKEISDPEETVPKFFAGLKVKSPEKHMQWYDFRRDFSPFLAAAKPSTASRPERCDQESYIEPRSEKDLNQCQEIDAQQERVYPRAWLDQQPKEPGIWSLISDSVYQEHMGLPRPRWDIMSRTGRQYRNAMVYENGFLGRRVIWKELWQERADKCNRQFKIFEGIEHHVRERGRTALEQINRANADRSIFPSEAYRTQVRNLANPEEIQFD